ncbi:MAG TPA: bifunctional DNA-formamidopyrimidine glycosylase/DNA-(apurinic or apyrimidinic site) lyase [Aeromicrobium sp.]|nr:bifunctional DNA-formamidopyrimidine glycosylase/DNA-(apurinic or apyrimidinic site) lyase [Aeromicrobium sp.]HKY58634.1 bifunctional DNA-formamidopyrimidine glycosylase/DNA-(apurinic or apyrimidinic site) lyase [Aeromicrobium sp.]
MPELPEVEVVRLGLVDHVVGRTIRDVRVLHERAVRRHAGGADDFAARLRGRRVVGAHRRGKFLWMSLDDGSAVLCHLGMSGQMLVSSDGDDPVHLRIAFDLDDGNDLLFVDQRTFGGLLVTEVEESIPLEVLHIAHDPLDPLFDDAEFIARLRRKDTGIKRALLDQTLISGVGNIYADEALWRSSLHYARSARGLRRAEAEALLANVRAVMTDALAQGGTSFDALYVNVNGQSGYFSRSLEAYGREGKPCRRCGTAIVREPFMNRSSFRCPTCQPKPRNGRW